MAMEMIYKFKEPLEMVEYPGKVVNVKKMLSTLGGIQKISQTFCGDIKRMELHFHPDNPYNKAAYGDICETNGILLSVKVCRSKYDSKKPPKYKITILGYVEKSYNFDSLCDFQYLPLVPSETSVNQFQFRPFDLIMAQNLIVPRSADDLDYFNRTGNAAFISLPTSFVRFDTPNSSILRNGCFGEDGQADVLGVIQKSNHEGPNVVSFNLKDSFPDAPNSQILKQMKVKYVSDEQFNKVKKLFEDCPIWTRIALQHESGVSYDKLKCLTPSMAYYFSSGPWRTLYVRYGYDPRKDYTSRKHQMFDFRLRYRSGISEFITDRKTNKQRNQNASSNEINSLMQNVDYPYLDEKKLPRSRQCLLRFSDIHIREVQKMLASLPIPAPGTICDARYGWLSAEFDSEVRQIVINNIKRLLKQYHRKNTPQVAQESSKNSNASMVEEEPVVEEEAVFEYGTDSNPEESSDEDD